MPTYTGIFPGPFKKDKDLQQILRKWQLLMKELVADDDVPWWYNERTSVGFFAAAIWKKGGQAIEEYTTTKKFLTRRGRTNNKHGRGDLLFYLKSDKAFVAEAKQVYLSLNRPPNNKKVISLLTTARKDAGRVPNHGAKRLGMVFMVPYSKSKPTDTDKRIREWINWVKVRSEQQKITAAWTFPSVAREIRGKEPDGTRYYYPGVILLLKPLKES